jgi:hypothetical protein
MSYNENFSVVTKIISAISCLTLDIWKSLDKAVTLPARFIIVSDS